MSKPIVFGPFSGLDVRRNTEAADPRSLVVADNVDLTLGGGVRLRDQWRRVAQLNPQSVGLYEINGYLRAIIPGGQNLPATEMASSVPVMYDAIGNGAAYPLNDVQKVTAVEGMGASAATGVYPYIVIQRLSGLYEHHWIRTIPATAATPVNTKISLPFTPSGELVKMQTKVWAPDNTAGAVYFSSTRNGPSDWLLVDDAGFLPVLSHVKGGRLVRGLGIYDNSLAVLFDDSVQLWHVDPSPANHALTRVMSGPGTQFAPTVRNVLGDLMYFSRGGFRSMKTIAITGQIKEDDSIGGPIFPLTSVQSTATGPVALWSQTRGAYICAFGNKVYVYKNQPFQKITGWTTYSMEWSVDYLVEVDGVVYARSGDDLYMLDAAYAVEDPIYDVQTQFSSAGEGLKRLEFIEILQRGKTTLSLYLDPTDLTAIANIGTVTGSTTPLDRLFCGGLAHNVRARFTGRGAWQLDRLSLLHTPCRF